MIYRVRCHNCSWSGIRVAPECWCYDYVCSPLQRGGCGRYVLYPCPRCETELSSVYVTEPNGPDYMRRLSPSLMESLRRRREAAATA